MPETTPPTADATRLGPQPVIAGSAGHLVTQAMRSIDIKQVLVGAGSAGSLGVGAVELGEATIDRLHSLPLSYHREQSVGATMT